MDEFVTMSHGAGGKATASLIESVFKEAFSGPLLTADDAALLPAVSGRLAMTTDGFVVSPQFFPGGNIGTLSVCGTINDLACMGARPLYLTCSFIIEEGYAVADLSKIANAMAQTAREAGAAIVAGDTKVVSKGQCGGVFITTAGVGEVVTGDISGNNVQDGDAVIVTGDIGRHGCAILVARGEFGIKSDITSDCAPLWPLVRDAACTTQLHAVRDATRGGVGTVLNEIAAQSSVAIEIDEKAVPVCNGVRGVCGLLGLEPLYMACEGRMIIFAPQQDANKVVETLKTHNCGKNAAIIGRAKKTDRPYVSIQTLAGGNRILPPPGGELLPRIC
jgi:hydrogenase expression/formation protein HypE